METVQLAEFMWLSTLQIWPKSGQLLYILFIIAIFSALAIINILYNGGTYQPQTVHGLILLGII